MADAGLDLPEREPAGAGAGRAGDDATTTGGFDDRSAIAEAVRSLGEVCEISLRVLRPGAPFDTDQVFAEVGGRDAFELVAQRVEEAPSEPFFDVGLFGAQGDAKLGGLVAARERLGQEDDLVGLVTSDDLRDRLGGHLGILRAVRWGKGFWGSLRAAVSVFFPNIEGILETLGELLDLIENHTQDQLEELGTQ